MPYVELHCHSCFSLLDGASEPEDLIARAAALGMPALALTDHDAVYAGPRFIHAAQEQGVRPLLGAELTLINPAVASSGDPTVAKPAVHHLTLLAADEAGWHNLCYLISRARHGAAKGQAALRPEELVGCTAGLIALSGCRWGEIPAALARGDRPAALAAARRYRELYGRENFWIELQRHHRPGDRSLTRGLVALAGYLGLGCVATNNVHYAARDGHARQDVLVCIRHLTTLDEALKSGRGLLRPNSEYYLKGADEMAALFPDHPEALTNTLRLAERCHFELNYGLQDLPTLPTPYGMSSSAYLRRLCLEALAQLFPGEPEGVRSQLDHELAVIEAAGLANYFLIVWDIVRFAREEGIGCQGRGSAANSLVAYLLGISPINPLAHDLVFERFLSPERPVLPDIDLDFDAARREEVIQYLYHRYGPAHTAMACTFVTFRRRSAVRDVGKVLGLPPELVATAVREWKWREEQGKGRAEEAGDQDDDPGAGGVPDRAQRQERDDEAGLRLLLALADQIDGFPRHLGIHSGGMIITGRPLMSRVPTEPATMPDRWVVQWDKEGLEDAGLVKIDLLGLRMLSAVDEAAVLAARMPAGMTAGSNGQPENESGDEARIDLARLTFDDPAVYAMIARADTIGVFQVESRAQSQMLPRLQPRCFADLVVAISLIRPGPIQGNMVHPYLRRRAGLEPVAYTHPLLEPALAETLGVILFQEQVLKVARDLAGFTPGQGEQLRRALGSKRGVEAVTRLRQAFLDGAAAQGVPADVAETVFEQLQAFGGYAFAKSHAAAFAVLVYRSAWLKQYYPAAFYTALLNNQPMGFWTPAVLVGAAKRQGLNVLPVDVTASQARCTVEGGNGNSAIRLGFNYVHGLSEAAVDRLLAGRKVAPFTNLTDFYRRVRPGRLAGEHLILAGAFDNWGIDRRTLLWEAGMLAGQDQIQGLDLEYSFAEVDLPPLSPAGALLAEQEALGLSTGEHVMAFYRPALAAAGLLTTHQLAGAGNGRRVQLAGLVVVHQSPPTAKGYHFVTLEDEHGLVDVIVRPAVFQAHARLLTEARLLVVDGRVQKEGLVVNILAGRLHPFTFHQQSGGRLQRGRQSSTGS